MRDRVLGRTQKNGREFEEDSIFLARRPFGPPRSENLATRYARWAGGNATRQGRGVLLSKWLPPNSICGRIGEI